ncbi:MAG: hypothetical protein Q4Q58_06620, partial [Thermoplasmata archaeon]|nr:hypothetical protein [Thermoplasmata archaeon]
GIVIVDTVGSTDSQVAIELLKKACDFYFRECSVISDKPRQKKLNLVLVASKEDDPHHIVRTDVPIQHISLDTLPCQKVGDDGDPIDPDPSDVESMLHVAAIQALIKKGLIEGSDPFYDWFRSDEKLEAHPCDRDWTFVIRPRIPKQGGKKREYECGPMYCLTLDVEGHITCASYDEVPDDLKLMKLWEKFDPKDRYMMGIVTDGTNSYAFSRTEAVMIPEVDVARSYLVQNRNLRNKDITEETLKACTDVRYCYDGGCGYYFVGLRAKTHDRSIHWGTHLYRVDCFDGGPDLPPVFFDMLHVPFVRYNQLTVVPYPFKYLREYMYLNGLEDLMKMDGGDESDESYESDSTQMVLDRFFPGLLD